MTTIGTRFAAKLREVKLRILTPPKVDYGNLGPEWLSNGYYTITLPCGSHRTIRIHTQQKGDLAGRRIASLLIGPDNTQDYESFAFIEPSGELKMWRRFAGQKQAEYTAILLDLVQGEQIEGYEYTLSKRCLICNRPLTTAESAELGIGPICLERMGLS